jgi:hypothetical protein
VMQAPADGCFRPDSFSLCRRFQKPHGVEETAQAQEVCQIAAAAAASVPASASFLMMSHSDR